MLLWLLSQYLTNLPKIWLSLLSQYVTIVTIKEEKLSKVGGWGKSDFQENIVRTFDQILSKKLSTFGQNFVNIWSKFCTNFVKVYDIVPLLT
jgi:hypothetical protein